MVRIRVQCYQPIGNPQNGFKPVGLEKVFDSKKDFTINHPNKEVNPLVYKKGQFNFSGKKYMLRNLDLFYKDNHVYMITIG